MLSAATKTPTSAWTSRWCRAPTPASSGAATPTFVLDLGSTNLTRVNGEPVRERELRDGDELRFARARCRFVSPSVDPVAAGV